MAKRIKTKEEEQHVYDSDIYKKSNALISAKYKSTLLENKLLAISLSKINEAVVEEVLVEDKKTPVLTSTLKTYEIQKLLGANPKSISSQLKSTYLRMANRQIGIENKEGEFSYRTLVIGADYGNGELKIYYNPLLGEYYQKLSKDYTLLSINTMMNFRSVYAFRLYELLKKECYLSRSDSPLIVAEKTTVFVIEYGVSELKFSLGIVNINNEKVQISLNKDKVSGKKPDYDRAVKVSTEKTFEKWWDFKTRVLDTAIKEINEKTEMNVSYEVTRGGKGGKIKEVVFQVIINSQMETDVPGIETELDKIQEEIKAPVDLFDRQDIEDDVRDLIEVKLKSKEIRSICEAADYQIDKVKKAYEVLQNQKGEVSSIVGFMIAAIKGDYEKPKQVAKKTRKKAEKKNSFNNFEQRSYDFEELERQLLKQ